MRILFCILFLVFSSLGHSQSHNYTHYTVEDGLPSLNVYLAFQDSKGYMWFATNAGVSRFNGYEFENFEQSNGLTDNTVFHITEDYKGRIWFGTFNCKLSYFENDSIYAYEHNEKIKEDVNPTGAITSFYVDSSETIWLGFNNKGIFKCDRNGAVKQILAAPAYGHDYKSIKIEDTWIRGSRTGKQQLVNTTRIDTIVHDIGIEVQEEKTNIKVRAEIEHIPGIRYAVCYPFSFKNKYMCVFGEKINIMQLAKDSTITTSQKIPFPGDRFVFSTLVDGDYIWFCVEGRGVYKYSEENNILTLEDHFLPGKSVSRVFKDYSGSYWFQTLKDGVYFLINEEIKQTRTEIGIKKIEIDTLSNQLYVIFDDKTLARSFSEKEELKFRHILNSNSITTIKYNYRDKTLLIGGSGKRFQYYSGDKLHYMEGVEARGTKTFLIDDSTIYRANGFGLSSIRNQKELYVSRLNGESEIWCTSLLKNGDDIWIGTIQGIRIFSDEHISNPFRNNKALSSTITSLERLDGKKILIGTKGNGVLIIENDSLIGSINEEIGLASNTVRKIHVDYEKKIWILTNKGLSKVEYGANGHCTIWNLNEGHGLSNILMNDLTSYRDTILFATNKGLIKFDKTKLQLDTIPPKIYITQFSVNSEKINLNDNIDLSFQENFIKINFEGLNYRSLGKVQYEFRMLGVDTNWVSTTLRFMQYPALQPSDYTFQVKAKNEDGVWSKPTAVSFTINPPFWLTWWFITAEIILGLTIVYFVFRYRERQLLLKGNAEKKMVELELKALRSQMNPHFIFNTLNSIQYYIAASDFRSTNKYIAQFSKLIRTVLNLSEKNVISIQEEIDMLELYMDLEKMRFEEQFEYEINIGEDIDTDYDEIPSMLIQPYVENSVWHGLMNSDKKGLIKVDLSIKGGYIYCVVQDNGIGRKKAGEIKAKRKIKRKSVGMSITQERLEIINDNEVSVEVLDLEDEKGMALGTKTIIKIPYND